MSSNPDRVGAEAQSPDTRSVRPLTSGMSTDTLISTFGPYVEVGTVGLLVFVHGQRKVRESGHVDLEASHTERGIRYGLPGRAA